MASMKVQELAWRLALMAGAAVAINVPCGMWRAHLRRLSPSWFLALHASIPAAITVRRALVLPKWAIALSIGSAVAGQQLGVYIERRRSAARRPGARDGNSNGGTGSGGAGSRRGA